MPDEALDLYAVRDGEAHEPPSNFMSRIKYLGPSLIISGAIIGSGELILTSSLGAKAGWALLWWMLVSCWSKSLVQAEVTRYVVATGDTYFRAINRIPIRIGRVSLPLFLGLLAYVPGTMGLGGILGAGAEAFTFLASLANIEIHRYWSGAAIAVVTSLILSSGSYKILERVMVVLVVAFTLTTLICSIAMQFTEYQVTAGDLASAFTFDFTVVIAFAALAFSAYGYTGMASADIAAYSFWCVEKGYPSFLGSDKEDPKWAEHARGWLKVLQTDVWLGLIVLTCATIPYYILGAGVLHKMGADPEGKNQTIATLSNMFTQTLGQWAVWVFSIGAFFILFSTVISGIGGSGRFIPDYLIETGFIQRSNVDLRKKIIKWYVAILPLVSFGFYVWIKNPIVLIMIGGFTSALLLPIQTGSCLWLHKNKLDPRVRHGQPTRIGMWLILTFQAVMAFFVAWYVVLEPNLKRMGLWG
jgi:Mn2+/Fe2+ NRAMP family transporter